MSDIDALEKEILAQINDAQSQTTLETVRVDALGKKGRVSALMKTLGGMSAEERKEKGPLLNGLKDRVNQAVVDRKTALEEAELNERLASERVDVTLPVLTSQQGRIHPISQTIEELSAIFADMGFSVAEGPDIETDEMNFTALNIPPEHPARQMHDTFYLKEKEDGSRPVLRTHTSPVQIRTMLAEKPPHRIIAPGRVYRCDSDQTHTPMFHQVEGLVIDRETHMGHLKWVLEEFCKAYFELDSVSMRFRPSHFPFTEPSMEVDIRCRRDGGQILLGEGDDWLEILGCGMVHPNVLESAGVDSEAFTGYAFGMGIERLAMLRYGVTDLRTFFDNDLRFLRQFR